MNENNCLGTRFNFAIVLNAPYPILQEIQRYIDGMDNVRVIYQELDKGKLWIKRGESPE